MKKTIVSTAVSFLLAGVAFAALDASATIAPLPAGQMYRAPVVSAGNFATALAAPSDAAFAVTGDVTPIMVARRGADDPPGHNAGDDRGRGRGTGTAVTLKRQGADDPAGHNAGDDRGRGRGTGAAVTLKSQGADDPPGDVRHGRGGDNPPGHK
jgi:hypothetical protein